MPRLHASFILAYHGGVGKLEGAESGNLILSKKRLYMDDKRQYFT